MLSLTSLHWLSTVTYCQYEGRLLFSRFSFQKSKFPNICCEDINTLFLLTTGFKCCNGLVL